MDALDPQCRAAGARFSRHRVRSSRLRRIPGRAAGHDAGSIHRLGGRHHDRRDDGSLSSLRLQLRRVARGPHRGAGSATGSRNYRCSAPAASVFRRAASSRCRSFQGATPTSNCGARSPRPISGSGCCPRRPRPTIRSSTCNWRTSTAPVSTAAASATRKRWSRISQDSAQIQIVWGGADKTAYPSVQSRVDQCRAVRGDLPITVVPNAGHWVQYEQADLVNRLLLNFHRA